MTNSQPVGVAKRRRQWSCFAQNRLRAVRRLSEREGYEATRFECVEKVLGSAGEFEDEAEEKGKKEVLEISGEIKIACNSCVNFEPSDSRL